MQFIRHISFAVISVSVLFAVLGNVLLDALPIGYEADTRSYLEARAYQALPSLDVLLDNPQEGVFQENFERYLADKVPLRDSIMMFDAGVKRACVQLANAVCRYDVYPTYFDASASYSEKYERFFMIPGKFKENSQSKMESAVEIYNELFERMSDRSFYIYAVPSNRRLDESPAALLVENPDSYGRFEEYFLSELRGVTVVDARVDFDDFLEGWSKSDHHWNIIGAYNAYEKIALALGFGDKLISPGELDVFEEPKSFGSLARSARWATAGDKMMDYEFDLGAPDVQANGSDIGIEGLAHYRNYIVGKWQDDLFAGRYSEFFHTDFGEVVIQSSISDSDRALLIVGDSFSNPIERLFSKHYASVYVLDPRHAKSSVSEFLSSHQEVEDVVILMQPDDLISDDFIKGL